MAQPPSRKGGLSGVRASPNTRSIAKSHSGDLTTFGAPAEQPAAAPYPIKIAVTAKPDLKSSTTQARVRRSETVPEPKIMTEDAKYGRSAITDEPFESLKARFLET